MARLEVDVRLGAEAVPVGRLIVEIDGQRQTSAFSYHASWLDLPRAFALSPSMPLRAAPFYGRHQGTISCLPGPVEDGSPDSWGRRIIEKMKGGAHVSDLDYLIGTDDFLRMGALRYFDAPGPAGKALAPTPVGEGGVGVPRLHDLEAVILEARAFEANPDDYAARRANLIGGGLLRHAVGSLGGARPKVNARDQNGALWIVKLPKQDDSYAMARAEVLALKLAAGVGILAAEARVLNDAPHFPMALVKRFDRSGADHTRRVPFISAQTFLGQDADRSGSYEELAMHMRAHCADPVKQIQELFRRMAFGILIRNTDDHLRNHGFLRSLRGWVLSPSYDINPEHRNGGRLQTPISEIHGDECSIRAALDAAEFFDLKPKNARMMVKEMAAFIAQNWRPFGGELGMNARDFSAVAVGIENDDLTFAQSLQG